MSIGIRREDKSCWECRSALCPQEVAQLVSQGLAVYVQPCEKRIYTDLAYERVGAVLTDDLSAVDLIVGVKEIPAHKLFEGKKHIFFPHVIKAQPANMEMLDAMLARKTACFDYERICDSEGRRLIKFGYFAGFVGAVSAVYHTGLRLQLRGISTPLLKVPYITTLKNKATTLAAMASVGQRVTEGGLPLSISPVIFAVVGDGACGHGAFEILQAAGMQQISVADLPEIVAAKDQSKIYCMLLGPRDTNCRKDGGKFDLNEFFAHPELYEGCFRDKIFKYVTCVINCVYWDERFPRLLTNDDVGIETRCELLSDVSCDEGGSIQWMNHTTPITHPVDTLLADGTVEYDSINSDNPPQSVTYTSIDILPSLLAEEASKHFSNLLVQWVPALVAWDPKNPDAHPLPDELARALVCQDGEYGENYAYVAALRKQRGV